MIKKLHWLVLKSFLPLFAMTFFIVLFIVLMQFLWKYIDDLVGKGLSFDVLGELFFYAAVTMVPMALPLAILLASLMTFGNFGEKYELTAMKASGISLVRVMVPLIVLISGVAVGAFFFQNDVLPKAQVKMWTLLFSVRQKSPEVEIPEGIFYDQIPGYNLFVSHKDKESGMLYDVIIYDVSHGGDNSTILRADSAKMSFTKGMSHLFLHLYTGEQFENLREAKSLDQNVPFRRENFKDKQVLIPFDANFNRMDEEGMRKQYVGKNIEELQQTIDSVGLRVDSIGRMYSTELRSQPVVGIRPATDPKTDDFVPYKPVKISPEALPFDTLIMRLSPSQQRMVYGNAKMNIESKMRNMEFKAEMLADEKKTIRRHEIELIKKFTLSVACLIFFFIGAPLGAIIRKGGLGTPLVISVLLFLVYYIIDNTGYKMARDGHWIVWMGMWLSTAILAPLGIYVTYKAMNDSAVFDKDSYMNLFRKLFGIKRVRKVEIKEIIMDEVDPLLAIEMLTRLRLLARTYYLRYRKPQNYYTYWMKGYDIERLKAIAEELDLVVETLRDCHDNIIVSKLADYPIIRILWIYHPSRKKWLSWTMMALFPVGLTLYFIGLKAQSNLKEELRKTAKISDEEINNFHKI